MDLTTTFTTIAGTTFTAIAGWLEDFEAESSDDYQFLTGLDLLWVDDRLNSNARLDGRLDGKELGDGCFDGGFVSVLDVEGFLGINNEDDQIISRNTEGSGSCSHGDGGAPHEGLFFTLSYLDVRNLLAVERVYGWLRSTVQNDLLLWSCIYIDKPLRECITNDARLGLTRRAQ
eukprot:TRINITY_DN2649_c0_g2_i1.p1 TRINITY_DN2649_c0_g2~~TRINITY_DN2649_c0_g2_i1.p1  ORF type:complete len:174 (-),score=20.56 TRINITY_DN2649_c0_g2_i1:1587-2108(-)